jgi:hypothetical protein
MRQFRSHAFEPRDGQGCGDIRGAAGFREKAVAAPIALEPNGRENLATTGKSDRMAVLFASIAWPHLPLSRWNGRSTIKWQPRTKRGHPTVTPWHRNSRSPPFPSGAPQYSRTVSVSHNWQICQLWRRRHTPNVVVSTLRWAEGRSWSTTSFKPFHREPQGRRYEFDPERGDAAVCS